MGCERPGGIFPPAASRWSTEPGQRHLFAQQAVSVVDLEACWRPHGQMKGSCGWRSLSPTLDTIWSIEGSRSRCTLQVPAARFSSVLLAGKSGN